VFGSAALVVFILQIVTGILLALIYVPSGAEAWSSLQTLNHDVTLGWFIAHCTDGVRTSWWRSSSFIWSRFSSRSLQVSRELTWIVDISSADDAGHGVHRQVLRFDQDAYWDSGSEHQSQATSRF